MTPFLFDKILMLPKGFLAVVHFLVNELGDSASH